MLDPPFVVFLVMQGKYGLDVLPLSMFRSDSCPSVLRMIRDQLVYDSQTLGCIEGILLQSLSCLFFRCGRTYALDPVFDSRVTNEQVLCTKGCSHIPRPVDLAVQMMLTAHLHKDQKALLVPKSDLGGQSNGRKGVNKLLKLGGSLLLVCMPSACHQVGQWV